jgi:peptidylprolyl isomerase
MVILKKKGLLAVAAAISLMACGPAYTEDSDQKEKQTAQASENKQTTTAKADSPEDILIVSEAFGHFIGRNLNSPGIQFDLEKIIKGIRDGAAGKPAPLSDAEYEKAMASMQEQAFKATAESNLKAAEEFLKKNKNTAGIIEIEPGKLQYMILSEGKGPAVTAHDTPTVHYSGKYLDGKEFGASGENEPISVPLAQTIQGFSKGIMGMKEGEKRRLFVHPELGYGTAGMLQPNALLIFDIEVVKATDPNHDGSASSNLERDNDEDSDLDDDLDND